MLGRANLRDRPASFHVGRSLRWAPRYGGLLHPAATGNDAGVRVHEHDPVCTIWPFSFSLREVDGPVVHAAGLPAGGTSPGTSTARSRSPSRAIAIGFVLAEMFWPGARSSSSRRTRRSSATASTAAIAEPPAGRGGRASARPQPYARSSLYRSVDSVGPEEQVADEVRHEDEQEPPEPPGVVRPPLEELDDRQPHHDGEGRARAVHGTNPASMKMSTGASYGARITAVI